MDASPPTGCASSDAASTSKGGASSGSSSTATTTSTTAATASTTAATNGGRFLRNGTLTRVDLFLIGKGGHPFLSSRDAARLSQQDLSKDLDESMARLGIDYFDFYLLHRDDPAKYSDVAEIVKTMDALVHGGKIRSWGVSNWTLARIEAACEYARAHGLHPPAMTSPQHSLAVPAQPVWPGCHHMTREAAAFCGGGGSSVDVAGGAGGAADGGGRASRMVRMVWAPLAEGYMCGSLGRPESAACWNTPDNALRRKRLNELASARAVQPSALALAFALNSGMADMVVVGTVNEQHFQDAARATQIALTDRDIAWLEGR